MAPDPLQWLCTTWCPLLGGVLQSQVSLASGTAVSLSPDGVEPPHHIAMSRHLNTFENMSRGANVQDGHVCFCLVVLYQASSKQQPEVSDQAGERELG